MPVLGPLPSCWNSPGSQARDRSTLAQRVVALNRVWWESSPHAVLTAALGVLILLNTGCYKETERSAPAAAKPVGRLVFRARSYRFCTIGVKPARRGLSRRREAGWVCSITMAMAGSISSSRKGDPCCRDKISQSSADVLLKNLGDGRFEDVSARMGLTHKGYGQGVTVADYDGDGDPDVYVTRYGRNTLWRNDRHRGRFTDATEEAGVACGSWSLGAAFADYDGDGDLDLFVANYFAFDQAKAPFRRNADDRGSRVRFASRLCRPPRQPLPQRRQRPLH